MTTHLIHQLVRTSTKFIIEGYLTGDIRPEVTIRATGTRCFDMAMKIAASLLHLSQKSPSARVMVFEEAEGDESTVPPKCLVETYWKAGVKSDLPLPQYAEVSTQTRVFVAECIAIQCPGYEYPAAIIDSRKSLVRPEIKRGNNNGK